MRNSCLTIAMAAACLLGLANTVAARVAPHFGGSGAVSRANAVGLAAAIHNHRDYGDYGGGVVYNSGPIGLSPSSRPLGSPSLVRSDIPLLPAQPNQQQLNQDWWFQQEGRQMASQRAHGYGSADGSLGFEATHPPPKANMDIVKWPTLLQRPTFASRRAQIEAPYRRSPPGLSVPTTEDYRAMVKTAYEMKGILEWLLQDGGLEKGEYDRAAACLNNIEQQARERSEPGGTSPKPES